MHRNAIALISDKNIFPAAVFLAHKLIQFNSRSDTDVVILSDWKSGFADARALVPNVVLLECDFEEPDYGMHRPTFREKTAYYLICMPHSLADYSRILYLDIDIYVASGKPFDLFDLNLGRHPIAAVRDINMMFRARHLNSGVVLIDADVYRQTGMEEKAFDLIRTKEKLSPIARDQVILNELYKGNWLELSPSFNQSSKYMRTELADAFPPEILHFIGPVKQWSTPSFAENHPARTGLVDFLAGSPWKDFVGSSQVLPELLKTQISRLSDMGANTNDFVAFLKTTEFADVVQGLTKPRLDCL